MRLLLPEPARESSADPLTDEDLCAVYAYPDQGMWLRANMVSSADGAASHAGLSGSLSDAADRRVFGVQRGLADAVVVGAGTVRAENYGPARPRKQFMPLRSAAGQGVTPTIVVVSRGIDVDLTSPLFTEHLSDDHLARPVIVAAETTPPARLAAARKVADVVIGGDERVAIAAVTAALEERGLRRVLCEGGPGLLAQIAAAGALRELCLTVSPLLTAGSAGRILTGPQFLRPRRMSLGSLVEEDGTLFARYLLEQAPVAKEEG